MSPATPSSETLFTLYYCYYIEILNNTLFRHLAHLIGASQMLIAALLMMQLVPMQWGGFFLAMLILMQLFYRPTGRSAQAAIQASRYFDVLHMPPSLTDDELHQRLQVIAQNDSPASRRVCDLAYNCAAIATGAKPDPLTGWITRLLGRLTSTPLA
ncbi:hypothetical protein I6G97_09750 [Edwardsiella hoshinae]|uniref:Uncharacterized protein n=1 Tax=Edwardsiella hoshinae TaxID=93378 RepID=A0A376DHF0_9GAMM|nr:hypothetical protein [Edwardsiella hoshinae]QPR26771.1 hypothetical protein I6G97_09750 [Edwardsiella hoshinae]STC89459.1 Uncharacterised protein [Edwardsiella hoshinae]